MTRTPPPGSPSTRNRSTRRRSPRPAPRRPRPCGPRDAPSAPRPAGGRSPAAPSRTVPGPRRTTSPCRLPRTTWPGAVPPSAGRRSWRCSGPARASPGPPSWLPRPGPPLPWPGPTDGTDPRTMTCSPPSPCSRGGRPREQLPAPQLLPRRSRPPRARAGGPGSMDPSHPARRALESPLSLVRDGAALQRADMEGTPQGSMAARESRSAAASDLCRTRVRARPGA